MRPDNRKARMIGMGIMLLTIIAIVLTPLWAQGKSTGKGLKELCAQYERQILKEVKGKNYRKAISVAAEYEQQLLARYSQPTFHMDLFQSEADHLSFHNSFTDWKQVGLKELELPEWLSMMGFDVLLALEGKVEDDRFLIISMNLGRIEQRMGLAEPGRTHLSDQELLLGAIMMADNFGVVKNHEFKTIGDHHTLVLDIDTPFMGPSVYLVNLSQGRKLYAFILISSAGDLQDNQKRLFELIKTVDFKYRPADEASIREIRKKFSGQDGPVSILRCISQLAAIGEYNAAAEELARLRIILNQCMPKPYIKGNVARHPAYGVSLGNPDDKRWKLSIEEEGPTKMLILEDRFSVREEGMAVVVLDSVLAYGPQAAKAIEDEELKKEILIGVGRGSALSMGTIENERFITVKGIFAYEATVAPNVPGAKAKCVWMIQPGFMLGILMMADANAFQEKIGEYERIIQGDWLCLDGDKGRKEGPGRHVAKEWSLW